MSKQSFYIYGITCSNCVQSVSDALQSVNGISSILINQKSGKLTLEANRKISEEELSNALPKKYAIVPQNAQAEPKWKQLFPLFVIFGFMCLTVFSIHVDTLNAEAMMIDFMAMFFMVFSFFKLLDLHGFQAVFKTYDPLAATIPFYGWIYPFIELALGLCYIRNFVPKTILITTLVVLGITTIGVVRVLLQKRDIKCACLGSVLNLPMTEATFIENAIMLVMAGSLLL